MKELKDWSKDVTELEDMDVAALENVYSDMLATAHDLKFVVPDELLVETQDPAKLREVIPPLHEAIKGHHSELKNKPAEATAPKKPAKAKKTEAKAATKAKKTETKAPKKPAKVAAQKDAEEEKTDMATTAKKTPAKKTASKAAPKAAKTAKAAKGGNANARTPVGRSKFSDDQKITVKFKDIPAREGSEVYNRLKNLQAHNGKTVGQFLKSSLGKSSTLAFSAKQGWVTIK